MTKKHYLKVTSILILISLILTSCDPSLLNTTKGDLVISFDQNVSKDTLEPQIKMDIDSYIISGTGPDGRTFTPITSNGDDVTISNLFNGDWTITVQGLNEDGIAIGEGSDTVTIVANKVNSAHIDVNEFIGDGTIDLGVNWPTEDISDPQIVATLSQPDLNISHNLSFIVDTTTGTASFNNNYNSGYYILNIALYDGDTTDINNKLIGKSYSLRIVKDNSTAYNLEIKKDDLNLYGEVSVSVANNISSSFEVSLNKTDVTLTEGNTQEFVATANTSGECTYYWYVDGEIQQESSNTFTTPNTLKLGTHSVDVIASKSGIFSSATSKITIQEDVGSYIKVKLLTRNTTTIEHEFTLTYGLTNIEKYQVGFPPSDDISVGELKINKFTDYQFENNPLFILASVNKVFNFPSNDEIDNWSIPDNLSMLQFEIPATTCKDMVINEVGGSFFTNTIADSYNITALKFNDINEAYLTVDSIGEIGEQVIGSIKADNVPFIGFSSFDENIAQNYDTINNYDVKIEFNIKRAEDIKTIEFSFINNIENSPESHISSAISNRYLTIPDDHGFTNEGYTFVGWNTESDGSGTTYIENDLYLVPESNTGLFAMWQLNTN
ncbi:MAG: hypothetical protein EOL97_09395 [Spirochaetia bacterium]|nr:hypothetical protein [Spirochaetia bacterium]